jgi:Trypsin
VGPTSLRLASAFVLFVATGCAFSPKARVPVRPASKIDAQTVPRELVPPPFALASSEDAVVRVLGPKTNCTGTLVEDDLVLTAHHCVVERGVHGEFTKKHISPRSLGVQLGGDDLEWGSVHVRAIVAPPCGEAGGPGDLAILVLEHKLVGLRELPSKRVDAFGQKDQGPPTPRLDHPPRIGESVTPIGFGRCLYAGDGKMAGEGIRRKKRPDATIRSMTNDTLQAIASICPGDSGAPVVVGSEIVGVVSLSAMDSDETTKSLSVFVRLDAYREVFRTARAIADGAEPSELPPLECK